jgi:hypothetical protein
MAARDTFIALFWGHILLLVGINKFYVIAPLELLIMLLGLAFVSLCHRHA